MSMRIVCFMWEHQIVMCVTIHNSFVLCNCPFCKLQLRTVCDLSATMYVTYVCAVYTGHIPEVTHYGVLWWGHNGGPKIKGREVGLSMEAIGIKANQAVL